MPFWAGMLTEEQHQLPELARLIQQVSFDLYFPDNNRPRPDFVKDQGINLSSYTINVSATVQI
jgi:hypothetical protein